MTIRFTARGPTASVESERTWHDGHVKIDAFLIERIKRVPRTSESRRDLQLVHFRPAFHSERTIFSLLRMNSVEQLNLTGSATPSKWCMARTGTGTLQKTKSVFPPAESNRDACSLLQSKNSKQPKHVAELSKLQDENRQNPRHHS